MGTVSSMTILNMAAVGSKSYQGGWDWSISTTVAPTLLYREGGGEGEGEGRGGEERERREEREGRDKGYRETVGKCVAIRTMRMLIHEITTTQQEEWPNVYR